MAVALDMGPLEPFGVVTGPYAFYGYRIYIAVYRHKGFYVFYGQYIVRAVKVYGWVVMTVFVFKIVEGRPLSHRQSLAQL